MLACLRGLSVVEILSAQRAVPAGRGSDYSLLTFSLVIDGVEFSKDPQKIIKENNGLQVPAIMFNVPDEGT